MTTKDFVHKLPLNHKTTVSSLEDYHIDPLDFLAWSLKLERFDLIANYQDSSKRSFPFDSEINTMDYLKKAITLRLDNIIPYFNHKLFTKELLQTHGAMLISIYYNDLKARKSNVNFLFENVDFFHFCLEKSYLSLVPNFPTTFFTTEIIKQYGKTILEAFNGYLPFSLTTNFPLLNYILDQRHRELYAFFSPDFFTDEIIKANFQELLAYIKEINKNFVPLNLQKNHYFLKRIFEAKQQELYFAFDESLYTEDLIKEFAPEIIKKIKLDCHNIPPTILKDNLALIKETLKRQDDLSLNFLFQESLLKDEEFLSLYAQRLGITKEELQAKLTYLVERNKKVFTTLFPKTLKYIDIKFVEALALYPNFQTILLNLNDKTLQVLAKIYNILDFKNYDFTTIIYHILNNIKKYEPLIANLDISTLTKEQLENLIYILQNYNTSFAIKDNKDLNDSAIQEQEENYWQMVTEKIKNYTLTIEELREALLMKRFNLDIREARFIRERYGSILESKDNKIEPRILSLVREINDILSSDSFNELKFWYISSRDFQSNFYRKIALEVAIRSEYARIYSDSLYKLKDEDKFTSNSPLAHQNPELEKLLKDKQVEFYIPRDDFKAQIHVLGAYREFRRPNNFATSWNVPIIDNHGIATLLIENDFLVTPDIKHPILGFASYERSALLAISNQNLYSDSFMENYCLSIANSFNFYYPQGLINHSLYGTNEILIERRNYKDTKTFKRQPDYIFYIVDDINNLANFQDDNQLYQETLQAARDFQVPIVIIDKLYFLKREAKKCYQLEQLFLETPNTDLLYELITKFFNNLRSCSRANEKEQQYFSKPKLDKLIQNLICFIRELQEPQKTSLLKDLITYLKQEHYPIPTTLPNLFMDNKNQDTLLLREAIAKFYYEASEKVQEQINKDLKNNIPLTEILRKIEDNDYEAKCIKKNRKSNF